MSRQRAWQREQTALGNCEVCGQAAAEGISGYCQRHYEQRLARRRRKRDPEELKQEQTCSYCSETGHNRRTCAARKMAEAVEA